jgi:signal transduction histidine kinase
MEEASGAASMRKTAIASKKKLNAAVSNSQKTAFAASVFRADVCHAELVRSRDEFARTQRFEATVPVIAGVAHDSNNILTVIRNSLETLQRDPSVPDRHRCRIDVALQATARCALMNKKLQNFFRPAPLRPQVLDPNAVIEALEPFIVQAVGPRVQVTTRLDPDLMSGRFNRTEFETAIINLVLNARDAMDGEGEIVLETRNIRGSERHSFTGDAARFVAIVVCDTGPGVLPEVAARAFEPFFTTKKFGKGTGLGLSQVLSFARAAGGDARIANRDTGAAIEILLPVAARAE